MIVSYLPFRVLLARNMAQLDEDLRTVPHKYKMVIRIVFLTLASAMMYALLSWIFGPVLPLGWSISLVMVIILDIIYDYWIKEDIEHPERADTVTDKEAEYYLQKIRNK
jgi:hypothetical protein